jgi:hypothetical protein
MNEERDYKAEYKKFQSSAKSKKYRAELNKYNRKKGTYGNGDGKDASHKGGKIVGFESQSKNRGRAEKSRLKKEAAFDSTGIDWSDEMMWKWVSKALKTAGIKELKYTPMKSGWLGGKFIWGGFYTVQANKRKDVLPFTVDKKGNLHLNVSPKKFIIGKIGKLPQVVKNLKDFKKSDMDVYESVNEAVSPKGWNMSKKFITILAREVKNLQKYHRQQNDEDFLEVANYMELQLKYMKKNLNESVNEAQFSKDQIEILRKSYGTLKTMNPSSPTYKKFIKFLEKLPKNQLNQLANANIKFVSMLAKNRIKGESVEEGFGGELTGKDKEKFEKARKENAEQLGYKVTGVSDIKESVNEAKSKTMKTIGSIIGKKQAQKISGVLVDMQTALVIMKVWNALGSSNRSKFEKLPIKQMANVAWKLIK